MAETVGVRTPFDPARSDRPVLPFPTRRHVAPPGGTGVSSGSFPVSDLTGPRCFGGRDVVSHQQSTPREVCGDVEVRR